METIQSKNNPLIKELTKLKQKKYRKLLGQMMVEGERNVKELVSRHADILYIFYKEVPLKVECKQIQCDGEVLAALSQTVTTPDYIAVVKIPSMVFKPPSTNFLVLENVADPGNLGTLIRTALAFDFKTIYMINCVDATNDKVVRASMGNFWDVDLVECNLSQIEELSKKFNLIVADMAGQSLENVRCDKKPFGIVLGNEANGVSEKMKALAKLKVAVRMKNNVESLNVAVAGAIIMNYFKGD